MNSFQDSITNKVEYTGVLFEEVKTKPYLSPFHEVPAGYQDNSRRIIITMDADINKGGYSGKCHRQVKKNKIYHGLIEELINEF